MPRLFAGTSGFAYTSWKPNFYPAKLPAKSFLSFYSERLNSTEINYTFRQLPKSSTLEGWVAATPQSFVFSLKAHMRLTHVLRLAGAAEFLAAFLNAVDPLRVTNRLGPILFQLPPSLKCDVAVLTDFLPLLPKDQRFTFEFRHPSWLTDPVYALLQEHNVALCLAESEKLVIPEVLTSNFVYARLRKEAYSQEERLEIARKSQQTIASGKDLYVYFKHEETPEGALYAQELLQRFNESPASTEQVAD